MNKILAASLFLLGTALAVAAAGKPNIVFLITDDQAPDTIAASNLWGIDSTVIRTPHMDRLAAGGTNFLCTYNMGAWHGAVCVASRSMLQTGRFLWHARQAEQDKFRDQITRGRLWSQRMKAAGYETYLSGKWHVETAAEPLFDHVVRVRPGMPKTVPAAYQRPIEGQADTWQPSDTSLGGHWEGGKHWAEVLADDAEAFLRQASAGDKPFFLYLAFNSPHDPRQSPKDFLDSYPLDKIPLPANYQPLNPHHVAMGLGPAGPKAMRDEALAPFPRGEFAVKTHRREYFAAVSHLDAQIGRILDAIDRSGTAGNTVVILTSDNGLAVGRHGLFGKQNMFEHSLRVPLLIRGPGIPRGETRDTRVYLQDAMATALDLAGADASGVDFRSLMPLLRKERDSQYPAIYGAFTATNQRAVIHGDHKLILYPATKTTLLFDLAKDALEQHDLAAQPESQAIKRRLFAILLEEQRKTGDRLELAKSFPDLAP